LELSEEEWDQGWYRCPECGRVTRLAESAADEGSAAEGMPAAEKTPAAEDTPAPKEPEAESAEWVQLKTAIGPEEAALEVAFLRANGVEALTWQQGAGHAMGLTVGPMGASHVMVREDQLELARSIMESEGEADLEGDRPADDEPSDTSKVVMGAAALALNPLGAGLAVGAGLAIGASQLLRKRDPDTGKYLVDCSQCGTPLELSDEEVAEGQFICPECQQLVQLSDYVICPNCQTELALDEAEKEQGWFRCPECDQVSHL
jgi:hypothetical protein